MKSKPLLVGVLCAVVAGAPLVAQESDPAKPVKRLNPLSLRDDEESARSSSTPPPESKTPAPEKVTPPTDSTEITASEEASFDEKNRQAIFIGNVKVVNPQFTLTAKKLTAFLAGKGTAAKPATTPAPGAGATPAGGGGLERAVAEGDVIIVQDQPGEPGKEPTRYVGRGQKADYDVKTGDITLSGWPQVQQGINNHIATEEGTVMIINRSGKMRTSGRSKTVIQDSSEETPER